MDKKILTREQAVAIVGEEAVKAVERENCEPTNRVYDAEPGEIEWAAEYVADTYILRVVYYTDKEDERTAQEYDWDYVNFTIHHYEYIPM